MELLNKIVKHSEYFFFNYLLILGLLVESLFLVNFQEYQSFVVMLIILFSEIYFLKQSEKNKTLSFKHHDWLYTYFMALSLASFGIVYLCVSNGLIKESLLLTLMLAAITSKFKIIQKNRKKEITK